MPPHVFQSFAPRPEPAGTRTRAPRLSATMPGARPPSPSEPARRGLISTIVGDVTAVLQSVVNEVAPGVVDVLDVQEIVERVDIQSIVDQLDIQSIVDQVDLQSIVERLDLDALLKQVDLDVLIERIHRDDHRPRRYRG